MKVYRIVTGNNVVDLAQQVNSHLKTGWEPQGGLVVSGQMYAQAVVLDRKEEK